MTRICHHVACASCPYRISWNMRKIVRNLIFSPRGSTRQQQGRGTWSTASTPRTRMMTMRQAGSASAQPWSSATLYPNIRSPPSHLPACSEQPPPPLRIRVGSRVSEPSSPDVGTNAPPIAANETISHATSALGHAYPDTLRYIPAVTRPERRRSPGDSFRTKSDSPPDCRGQDKASKVPRPKNWTENLGSSATCSTSGLWSTPPVEVNGVADPGFPLPQSPSSTSNEDRPDVHPFEGHRQCDIAGGIDYGYNPEKLRTSSALDTGAEHAEEAEAEASTTATQPVKIPDVERREQETLTIQVKLWNLNWWDKNKYKQGHSL